MTEREPENGMNRPERGILIAFEGSDGAGKTTALEALYADLEQKGYPVIKTREPGGSPTAEKIRALLLDPQNSIDPRTEALLYAASRREHIRQTILPALERGEIVLSDRFLDSSLAYQGYGRLLGEKVIEHLNDFALEGLRPDATLFYRLDEQSAKERRELRGDLNRLDAETRDFFDRVNGGFEQLLTSHPDRYLVIDASRTREEVAAQTISLVEDLLRGAGYGR